MVATAIVPICVLVTFSDSQYNQTQRNHPKKKCELKPDRRQTVFNIWGLYIYAGFDIQKI